ncbi:MAG: helix-turn-helix transcriptional regulator [Spirochaetota bacterium]
MHSTAVIDALLEHAHFRANSIGALRLPPGERRERRTDANLMVLIDSGSASMDIRTRTMRASSDDLVTVPMGSNYFTASRSGCKFRYIEFDIFISDSRSLGYQIISPRVMPGFLRTHEGKTLSTAVDRVLASEPFARATLNGALAVAASTCADVRRASRSGGEDTRAMRQFAPVLDIVRRRYHERLTVRDLAAAAGLTESHFCNSFKRTFGVSPLQYLMRIKLYSAQQMLREGSYSVVEIARRLGFSDQATFSRAFKRYFRVPPSKILPKMWK